GSVARNEDGDDSDVDILVVQENDRIDLQRNLSFLSYDIGSFYNEHLSVQSIPLTHMKEHSEFSFYDNIYRDGIHIG
ncbi:MAG: nucleotidyltransferase domain-containing protein, partial [Candidatus Thermoplasmatota archaeon]|nr:nucleotidyltransferase domain-containing protein [Candidatus Thermoplasmatota archaeon]